MAQHKKPAIIYLEQRGVPIGLPRDDQEIRFARKVLGNKEVAGFLDKFDLKSGQPAAFLDSDLGENAPIENLHILFPSRQFLGSRRRLHRRD